MKEDIIALIVVSSLYLLVVWSITSCLWSEGKTVHSYDFSGPYTYIEDADYSRLIVGQLMIMMCTPFIELLVQRLL